MIGLDVLRAWTGAPASEANDALLLRMERAAVARVEAWTGLPFGEPAERVDTLTGTGTTTLYLSAPPVGPVVVEELWYPGHASPTTLPSSSYGVSGSVLTRYSGHVWYAVYMYRVTYQAGYAPDAVPELYQDAVVRMVSMMWNQRGSEDLASEGGGGFSFVRNADALDAVLRGLPRRWRV